MSSFFKKMCIQDITFKREFTEWTTILALETSFRGVVSH